MNLEFSFWSWFNWNHELIWCCCIILLCFRECLRRSLNFPDFGFRINISYYKKIELRFQNFDKKTLQQCYKLNPNDIYHCLVTARSQDANMFHTEMRNFNSGVLSERWTCRIYGKRENVAIVNLVFIFISINFLLAIGFVICLSIRHFFCITLIWCKYNSFTAAMTMIKLVLVLNYKCHRRKLWFFVPFDEHAWGIIISTSILCSIANVPANNKF